MAILNRDSQNFFTTDPLLLVRKILSAAQKRWGITAASEGAEYLGEKISRLSAHLSVGDGGNELVFPIPSPASLESATPQDNAASGELKYYLAAVTPYNVLTPLMPILTGENAE